jgi:hypothetical protein
MSDTPGKRAHMIELKCISYGICDLSGDRM